MFMLTLTLTKSCPGSPLTILDEAAGELANPANTTAASAILSLVSIILLILHVAAGRSGMTSGKTHAKRDSLATRQNLHEIRQPHKPLATF
jgi:uncharacterized membrane protein